MQHRFSVILLSLTIPALAACQVAKEGEGKEQAAVTTAPATEAPAVPATPSTPPASVPSEGRVVPVNVQGTAAVGATVRVKSVELAPDATLLTLSASYGGTTTNSVNLAGSSTYLMDEQGNKLMLKPPQDNPDLKIVKGQMMDGKLVFLGAVPSGAKTIRLVFNDNNDGDSIIDPGLTIQIPLTAAGN